MSDLIKRFISITFIAGIGFWLILIFALFNGVCAFSNISRCTSLVLLIITSFWAFYFQYGWRCPLLKHLLYKPDLNGTWVGKMESDYNSKKYEYGLTKPFAIVIRQTFLKIHVTSFTDTFTGVSYGESFYVIKDKGVRRLTYLYSNDPDNPNTKLDRQGVCELKAVNDPATQLAGKFWTINGSNGNISVNKSTGEHLESYNSIMKK